MKIHKTIIISLALILVGYTNFVLASEITGNLSTGLNGSVNDQLAGTVIVPNSNGGGGGYVPPVVIKPVVVTTVPAVLVTTPVIEKVLVASNFKFSRTLKRGMSSDAVKELQERLRAEGFFTITPSIKYFGPGTFKAVKAYQKAHKLPSTGFVGPLTLAELNK